MQSIREHNHSKCVLKLVSYDKKHFGLSDNWIRFKSWSFGSPVYRPKKAVWRLPSIAQLAFAVSPKYLSNEAKIYIFITRIPRVVYMIFLGFFKNIIFPTSGRYLQTSALKSLSLHLLFNVSDIPSSAGIFFGFVAPWISAVALKISFLLFNATFGPWLDLPSHSTNRFLVLSSENCGNEKLTPGRTINCFCNYQTIYT